MGEILELVSLMAVIMLLMIDNHQFIHVLERILGYYECFGCQTRRLTRENFECSECKTMNEFDPSIGKYVPQIHNCQNQKFCSTCRNNEKKVSPTTHGIEDSVIFCSTCLHNQLVVVALMANGVPENVSEAIFRNRVLKRHPIQCSECELKIESRINNLNLKFKKQIFDSRLRGSKIRAHDIESNAIEFWKLKAVLKLFEFVVEQKESIITICGLVYHSFYVTTPIDYGNLHNLDHYLFSIYSSIFAMVSIATLKWNFTSIIAVVLDSTRLALTFSILGNCSNSSKQLYLNGIIIISLFWRWCDYYEFPIKLNDIDECHDSGEEEVVAFFSNTLTGSSTQCINYLNVALVAWPIVMYLHATVYTSRVNLVDKILQVISIILLSVITTLKVLQTNVKILAIFIFACYMGLLSVIGVNLINVWGPFGLEYLLCMVALTYD